MNRQCAANRCYRLLSQEGIVLGHWITTRPPKVGDLSRVRKRVRQGTVDVVPKGLVFEGESEELFLIEPVKKIPQFSKDLKHLAAAILRYVWGLRQTLT